MWLLDVPDFVREDLWGHLRLVWVGLIAFCAGLMLWLSRAEGDAMTMFFRRQTPDRSGSGERFRGLQRRHSVLPDR